MLVSRQDFAKYPFTKETTEYIRQLDLRLDELDDLAYAEVVNRAEERIQQALGEGIVFPKINFITETEIEAEILSYTVARVLVVHIADDFLRRRFALAEANRSYYLLSNEEDNSKLLHIAQTTMEWRVDIQPFKEGPTKVFTIDVSDYLRVASDFHDDYWKIVNRKLKNGRVVLEKRELARLMSGEINKKIKEDLEKSPKVNLYKVAPKLASHMEVVIHSLIQRKESLKAEELPSSIIIGAYPPCIKKISDNLLAGQHISHTGRFALTSFFLGIGMKTDDLIKLYTSVSDFSEDMTRYQVEHIAGLKGSGTKYSPPKCDSLKTNNLCPGPDKLCGSIWHPLSYYLIKTRMLLKEGRGSDG